MSYAIAADPSSFSRQLIVAATPANRNESASVGGCQSKTDAAAAAASSYRYSLLGLNESQVKDWAVFCASVFAYKASPPSPSYFERHYHNDPRREASLIRVAIYHSENDNEKDDNGTIVASCRIFRRTVSDGKGNAVQAGGIGEVCTSQIHRRRGLSKELLSDCLEIMKHSQNDDDNNNMRVSLLHAAPDFFPVYKSAGYVNSKTEWSVIPCHTQNLPSFSTAHSDDSTTRTIRLAEFPKDTPQLMEIYRRLYEQSFAGCIIRSEQYWNEYIAKELERTLFVLVENDNDGNDVQKRDAKCGDDSSSKQQTEIQQQQRIIGYLSVRMRSGRVQLRDFGNVDDDQTYFVLGTLLKQAMQDLSASELSGNNDTFDLLIPTKVLERVRQSLVNCSSQGETINSSYLDWDNKHHEDDWGWMYQPIIVKIDSPSSPLASEKEEDKDVCSIPDAPRPHLIWPADSF